MSGPAETLAPDSAGINPVAWWGACAGLAGVLLEGADFAQESARRDQFAGEAVDKISRP
jgi:hypothetical protein